MYLQPSFLKPGSHLKIFWTVLIAVLTCIGLIYLVLIEFARCNNVTGFVLDEVVYEIVGGLSKGKMRQNRIKWNVSIQLKFYSNGGWLCSNIQTSKTLITNVCNSDRVSCALGKITNAPLTISLIFFDLNATKID